MENFQSFYEAKKSSMEKLMRLILEKVIMLILEKVIMLDRHMSDRKIYSFLQLF